ncbi:MAG TPA: SdpI family protein [Methanoregulaceae archaeon]|nr:SdpI family protein [Methanoregulaceae archaeon]
MAASYPLTKRTIGMNRWYGIRFPQAFYSDENWYEINAYGGRVFMKWAGFVAISGIVFIFIPLDNLLLLFSLYMSVFATIIIPVAVTYAYAKKFKCEAVG